jgi:predicted ATP-grasp superfamily ATP-dependent carboligase
MIIKSYTQGITNDTMRSITNKQKTQEKQKNQKHILIIKNITHCDWKKLSLQKLNKENTCIIHEFIEIHLSSWKVSNKSLKQTKIDS